MKTDSKGGVIGRKDLPKKIAVTLIMWAFGVLMIFPFLWMISASFKDMYTMFDYPIKWLPDKWDLHNYITVWAREVPFGKFYMNSIIVTVIAVSGTFFSCSMAGYAYSKIRFVGRDKLFLLKLSTTMIPAQVTMLPTFIIYSWLGLVDKSAALWLPSLFGGAFGVFLMRQFFTSLPDELIEAAKIDGCSHPGIFWKIAMPLARSALATLVFIYFTWTWNDYERPLLYLRSAEKFTLPLAVKYFADDQVTNFPAVMAASTSMTLPIILLFFFAQKYFVQSMATAGLKG